MKKKPQKNQQNSHECFDFDLFLGEIMKVVKRSINHRTGKMKEVQIPYHTSAVKFLGYIMF